MFAVRKTIITAIMYQIFLYQVYTNLAYVPHTYRKVKKLRVLTINKNLRKSLASRNGNDILIWSWNNPLVKIDFPMFEYVYHYEEMDLYTSFVIDTESRMSYELY